VAAERLSISLDADLIAQVRAAANEQWAGGAHLIFAEVGADLALTRVPGAAGRHQRVRCPGRNVYHLPVAGRTASKVS